MADPKKAAAEKVAAAAEQPAPEPTPAPEPAPAPVDAAPPPPAPAPEPPKPRVPPYTVAPGTSIVCAGGHLDAGTEISARDFVGGQKDLDDLIARGAIVKS
jgi:hypothetical protein